MIEEVNKDTKKKIINLKVQNVLLEQRALKCFWDKSVKIQLTSSEFSEADLELHQTDAEALLKIFENHWLPIGSIFSTCQLVIYIY